MATGKFILTYVISANPDRINRYTRLMRSAGLKAQVGYRKPRYRKGDSHVITPNRLQRQFNPLVPDEVWVTDITYIRTHEG